MRSLPAMGVLAGDRVEPHRGCPDVGDIDRCHELLVRILLWRPGAETVARHECPLFVDTAETGISIETVSIDTMHTLHLGIFQVFLRSFVWRVIEVNAFQVQRGVTEDELVQLTILQMRGALWAWYAARHRDRPDENLTRLHDLTPKMVGSKRKPRFKAKAAETWGFLLFSQSLAQRFRDCLGETGPLWGEAAGCLIRYIEVCRKSPRVLPASALQDPPPPPSR